MNSCDNAGSHFVVNARLRVSIEQLRERLSILPGLKMLSYGTVIKCDVGTSTVQARLECARQQLTYTCSASQEKQQPHYTYLLKFLALLAALSDCYEVHADQLYYYVMEAFTDYLPIPQPRDNLSNLIDDSRLDALAKINLSLSREITRIISERDKQKAMEQTYNNFCKEIMSALTRAYKTQALDETLQRLGISKARITEVTEVLKESRNKPVHQ